MTAAQIAHTFLMRGLKAGLSLSQFAAIAWLAANESGDRIAILTGIGLTVSSTNGHSVLSRLVDLRLARKESVPTAHGGHAKLIYTITADGRRLLGLDKTEVASS